METIGTRLVSDPFFALFLTLFLTLALAAPGLSGRPSMKLARFLLVAAWVVGVLGLLRVAVLAALGPVPVALAVVVFTLVMIAAILSFRPAVVPLNVGKIVAKRRFWSWRAADPSASFEIGASGVICGGAGVAAAPALYFGDSRLTVQVYGGRVLVSTQIRDKQGRLVAVLDRNEWKVANDAWDRNYNKDTVEVKGPDDTVVLQVRALRDRVQIQGEWWGSNGRGVRLLASPGGASIVWLGRNATYGHEKAIIAPIFRYPSELHLGHTVK